MINIIKEKINGIKINSTSTPEKCWRLIHDGKTVIDLFEAEGITSNGNLRFAGTKKECDTEIKRLTLILIKMENDNE